MNKPFVLGVAGGSGSGKTYFINTLLSRFEEGQISHMSQDNYYKPIDHQPVDEHGVENFDTPGSIDRERYLEDLKTLIKGQDIALKEYTFNNDKADAETIVVKPAPIIIVEGIFALHYNEIQDLLDLRLFIDAPEYLMLKRRILRDQKERGYDTADVLHRYEHHVMPTYESYILPAKKSADLVIPNNSGFGRALDVLTAYLKTLLQ